MGALPASRVNRSTQAFENCSLDYMGPMQVRIAGGRGVKSRPAYVAIFVCMATKAIYLKVVTDYTTGAFLAAFSRFCSRRSISTGMYSDRDTDFKGASRELSQAFVAVCSNVSLHARFASDHIRWSFIPPAVPH